MSPIGWTEPERGVSDDVARVKQQRNLLGVAAVLLVLVGMSVCLPRVLVRRQELATVTADLLQLQAELGVAQQQIGAVEAEILAVQDQIKVLTSGRP